MKPEDLKRLAEIQSVKAEKAHALAVIKTCNDKLRDLNKKV